MEPLQIPKGRTFQTKQALAYVVLREAIMSGRLAPGTRLVIDDIAKRLSLSAIPVREALQTLQSERLIETRPHAGAVVADIDPAAVHEIFALLEALEIAAFRLAVRTATTTALARLEKLQTAMEAAAQRGDDQRWAELNSQFHRAVPEIAGMPRAVEMIERISGDWERLRRLRFPDVPSGDPAEVHRQHRAMIAALKAKDEKALVVLAQQHNREALGRYGG